MMNQEYLNQTPATLSLKEQFLPAEALHRHTAALDKFLGEHNREEHKCLV